MRFLRRDSGSTAVEFALVFPLMLMVLALAVELGSYFFQAVILEAAVTRACQGTLMGQDGSEAIRQSLKAQILAMDRAKLLNPGRLKVTLTVHGTSDSMYKHSMKIHNPAAPEEPIWIDANMLAITGAAASAEILQLHAVYRWKPVLPFTATLLGFLPPIQTLGLMRYEPT